MGFVKKVTVTLSVKSHTRPILPIFVWREGLSCRVKVWLFHLNYKPEFLPFSSLPLSSIYHFCFTQAHNHSPTQQQNLKELTDSPHLRSSPGSNGTLGLKPDHKCVPSELYTVLRSAHLVYTVYYLNFKCLYKIERFHIKIQFFISLKK